MHECIYRYIYVFLYIKCVNCRKYSNTDEKSHTTTTSSQKPPHTYICMNTYVYPLDSHTYMYIHIYIYVCICICAHTSYTY